MRRLCSILLLLLLACPGLQAQFVINPAMLTKASAGGATLLLDETGLGAATTAYSVRQLRAAYTGDIWRVRRSSDSAECDVEKDSGGYITINSPINDLSGGSGSTLTAWAVSNDLYLVTWYDQSGNAYNATQSTAALQPQVATAGVLNVDGNGVPRIRFNSHALSVGNVYSGSAGTVFAVLVVDNYVGQSQIWRFGNSGIQPFYAFSSGDIYEEFASTSRPNTGTGVEATMEAPHLYSVVSASSKFRSWFNGSQFYTSASNTVGWSTTCVIGSGTGGMVGYYQEIVVYEADKESVRATAEANINAFFTLY